MRACHRRSAPGAQRVASGRTVSKAAPSSAACMHKADRTRRHRKERRVDAVLGIDIAKAKFAVALLTAGRQACAARAARIRRPALRSSRRGCSASGVPHVHACLEATGTYGDALATWLHDAGHVVSVVNPGDHSRLCAHAARAQQDRSDRCGADRALHRDAPARPPGRRPPREIRAAASAGAAPRRAAGHAHAGSRIGSRPGVVVADVRASIEAVAGAISTRRSPTSSS